MSASRLSPPASRLRKANHGFALLITITLLAFLVVLLIGLAAYSRVETAIAGNTQRQTQARQNALLGLNVALGQLQKFAGPDQRVTATADSFGGVAGTRHFTGVWDTTQPASTTPATWLVSGNEYQNGATSVTPTTAFATSDIELVGAHTTGTARDVVAKKQPVLSVGVPGILPPSTPSTIGSYAWWVGDQGVKAPVAIADNSNAVNYAPWDSAELRARLRQQVALGAGAADASGNPVFETRDTANSLLVANQKVTAYNQLAFLRNASAAAIGLTPLKTYFHAWSPNNFAVLANTKLGGLRQDLSLDPTLLGPSFAAWANYDPANGGYMEDFTAPATPIPTPALTADPLRRRYVMQGGGALTVAPVVSYFLISFNVRTQNGSTATKPLEIRAFWKVGMWNPYSSALVPEDNLRLEVTGLPSIRIDDDQAGHSGVLASVSLQSLYGSGNPNSALRILLPWSATPPSSAPGDDRTSWLPGRVYNWRSAEELSGTSPSAGYPSRFYAKSYTSGGETNGGVIKPLSAVSADGSDFCHIDGDSRTIRIKLIAVRSTGEVELANFTSPQFTSFSTTSRALSRSSTQFVYIFRVAESTENPLWLQTAGSDPHLPAPSSALYAVGPNGDSPAVYADDYEDSTFPDRLLDRDTTKLTFGVDTPVFELPRAPLLSLGELQHLAVSGQRPFAVGNSWGMDSAAPFQLNGINASELFDRFFFSGLVSNLTIDETNANWLLPNPQLKRLRNSTSGVFASVDDLRTAPTSQSSKFLLQSAAFNLNSTNALAWAAVLRGTRFPAPQSFKYLDADVTTGTASDDVTATVQSGDAQFFRFAHAAGETYATDPNVVDDHALFRKGMCTLSGAQVTALANAITIAIAARHATTGPFLSLEEFLGPATTGNPSLLEQAIVDAKLNDSVAEFSSQWLTQGDIMTALAPVLFPRSDTFVIRAYGQAVNPTTGATEGHAWCEATVQRVPDYFDTTNAAELAPTDPALTSLNQTFGRRFKIVSFRWLTRSDI